MCREIISEFESFMYLIDEIVTRKEKFENWSEFKVRHKEMLFVLLFIILVNLFDRKVIHVS